MAEYARVGRFANRNLAELAVTYLNANGIEAVVVADDAGGQYPYLALLGRGIWLRVPAEDAEAARQLFAEAEAQAVAEDGRALRSVERLGPGATWGVRAAAALVAILLAAAILPRL